MNLERAILIGGPMDGATIEVSEVAESFHRETSDNRIAIYTRTDRRTKSFPVFIFSRYGALPRKVNVK